MAKGKRKSDPVALEYVLAKLKRGEKLCEDDRPYLLALARLDFIDILENKLGMQLIPSNKNSVKGMVKLLLGPPPQSDEPLETAVDDEATGADQRRHGLRPRRAASRRAQEMGYGEDEDEDEDSSVPRRTTATSSRQVSSQLYSLQQHLVFGHRSRYTTMIHYVQ